MRTAIFLGLIVIAEKLAKGFSEGEGNAIIVFFFIFIIWDVVDSFMRWTKN